MNRRITVAIVGIWFCVWFSSSFAWSSGISTHLFITDLAIENIKDPDLAVFLIRNKKMIQNGSIFADSGYTKSHQYGEFTHWEEFINGYMLYLNEKCTWPISEDCENLFAFLLGSISHTLTDVIYHRDFVQKVAEREFKGHYLNALHYSDAAIDVLGLFDHHRNQVKFEWKDFPVSELEKIYPYSGYSSLNNNEINDGLKKLQSSYQIEKAGSPFTYLYYKFKAPWITQNYLEAQGGIQDSAFQVAQLWQQIWTILIRDQSFLNLAKFKKVVHKEEPNGEDPNGEEPNIEFFLDY